MKWYDLISPFYDVAIRSLYEPYRKMVIQKLELQDGETVLDLGCGSGLNFEPIMAEIGPQGILVGVDVSAKMLARARKVVNQNGWKNVRLFQQDVRRLDAVDFEALMGASVPVDKILCTLGMSVFPDWQVVFDKTFSLLKSGGKYGLMDLFNSDATLSTRLVNLLASSEISRRVWEPLHARCVDYHEEKHKAMRHGSDVIVIAIGTKS
jgi:ubiquinone/menaquinone biosynthesis C-methylase UbiE